MKEVDELSPCGTVSSNTSDGILNQERTITVAACTISGNSGNGIHGGKFPNKVTAMDCTISGNTGRGIYIETGATTLVGCTVSGNYIGIDVAPRRYARIKRVFSVI